MTAPICATILAAGSRSRRAIRDACSVSGTASGVPAALGLRRFQHRLGQLLDKERHAVGLRHDAVQHWRGQNAALDDLPGERRRVVPVEPAQGHQAHAGAAEPGVPRTPGERRQPKAQAAPALARSRRPATRSSSGPTNGRPRTATAPAPCAPSPTAGAKRGDGLRPQPLRGQLRDRIAPVRWDRQQRREEGDVLRWRRGRRQDGFQLRQTVRCRVAAGETGFPFQSRDDRIERAILMQRRAKKPQAGMWFASQLFFQCGEQPRLADPGSPESNTMRPSPRCACCQARSSEVNSSSRPTSGGSAARWSASERVPASTAAKNLPRWHRTRDALQIARTEVAVNKQIAGHMPRCSRR